MRPTRALHLAAAGGIVFGAAFAITYLTRAHMAARSIDGLTPLDVRISHVPRDTIAFEELLMVYVGAASCGWSNVPEMQPLLRDVKLSLVSQARANGWRFQAVGIAIDWDVQAGLAHLLKYGPFDQVTAGGNWGNETFAQILSNYTEVPSTPQIVVLRRRVRSPDFESGYYMPSVAEEAIAIRLSGVVEMKRWVRNGAQVPALREPRAREARQRDSTPTARIAHVAQPLHQEAP